MKNNFLKFRNENKLLINFREQNIILPQNEFEKTVVSFKFSFALVLFVGIW